MTLHQTYVTQLVYGIPYEWFEEINDACDAYFKRKGIKWPEYTIQDLIYQNMRLGHLKKQHKHK